MLGEATLDALGTFLGEAIRFLILFAAQQTRPADDAQECCRRPRRADRVVQDCRHQIEPDPAEITQRYDARRPHWVTDLAGGRCRIAPAIRVTDADRTAL